MASPSARLRRAGTSIVLGGVSAPGNWLRQFLPLARELREADAERLGAG